jgi:hypothetical protein
MHLAVHRKPANRTVQVNNPVFYIHRASNVRVDGPADSLPVRHGVVLVNAAQHFARRHSFAIYAVMGARAFIQVDNIRVDLMSPHSKLRGFEG